MTLNRFAAPQALWYRPLETCQQGSAQMTGDCRECKQPLVEIDNRGTRLTGCMTCNIWWSLTGGGAVKLSVEDLYALQQLKQTK